MVRSSSQRDLDCYCLEVGIQLDRLVVQTLFDIYGYSSTRKLLRYPPQYSVVAIIVGTLVCLNLGWLFQFSFLKTYHIRLQFTNEDVKISSVWPKPSNVPLKDIGHHHFILDRRCGWSPGCFVAGETTPCLFPPGTYLSSSTLVLGVSAWVGMKEGAISTLSFWLVGSCVAALVGNWPWLPWLSRILPGGLGLSVVWGWWELLTWLWEPPKEDSPCLPRGRAHWGTASCSASWGMLGSSTADWWVGDCVCLLFKFDSFSALISFAAPRHLHSVYSFAPGVTHSELSVSGWFHSCFSFHILRPGFGLSVGSKCVDFGVLLMHRNLLTGISKGAVTLCLDLHCCFFHSEPWTLLTGDWVWTTAIQAFLVHQDWGRSSTCRQT